MMRRPAPGQRQEFPGDLWIHAIVQAAVVPGSPPNGGSALMFVPEHERQS